MNLLNLERCFKKAKETGAKYIALFIKSESEPSVVIHPADNADELFLCYKRIYDEKLVNRFSKDVKIIGFTFGNTFQEIEEDFEN